MTDMTPVITPEVIALMGMQQETVSAATLAPIVKMHPSVIVHYAKTGRWDLCRYVVSGDRVKFFRVDFLRKMGFLADPPDPEPEMDLEEQILETLIEIRELLREMTEKKGEVNNEERGDLAEG